ncbi:hypothetical protein [Psychroserpens mesophilus]|uniref:hypothetical protein n=1 Tax=Psychroserpens mesophilus TaxID=325473 RepID=UPI003F49751C
MKYLFTSICLTFFISSTTFVNAQASIDNSKDFIERSPVYDYTEAQLNNTDTIPGFESKLNKLKITGTIYESDGVTPAKDVILYIDQADENGDFDLRYTNEKRYVYNRGWIKTNADGTYTFYTYIPGNDRRYNQMQQLFPIVKEPSKDAYEIASFLFNDDPFLTKTCRKRLTKKGDPSRILTPKIVDGLHVVEKDIILNTAENSTK